MEVQVDGEDDDHEHQRHLHEEIAESANAAFEFRFLRPQFQPFRHLAEFGLLAGDDDQRLGASADHMGSHPQRVGPLRQRRFRRQHADRFLRGVGFTGQGSFIDKEILGFVDQAISRDEISGVQDDDIARHDLFDRNVLGLSVAKRGGLDLHHGQQLLHGAGCAVLLPEAEKAAGEDDGENDEGVDGIVQEERQPGGKQEKEDDRTLELAEQERERIRPSLRLEEVRAVAGEPLPCFLARQPFPGRSELLQHLGRRDAPKGRRRLIHADCRTGKPNVVEDHAHPSAAIGPARSPFKQEAILRHFLRVDLGILRVVWHVPRPGFMDTFPALASSSAWQL